MGTTGENFRDEDYSPIKDKGELGFVDFEEDKSLHSFDPTEEGSVFITYPFPYIKGKPQSALVGETSAASIDIKNTTNEPIDLWSVRIYASNPEGSFLLSVMKPPLSDSDEEATRKYLGLTELEERMLQPGQTLTIWLSCRPKEIGVHSTVVQFDVGEKIERGALLLAEDKVSLALTSTKPYFRTSSRPRRFDRTDYVGASRAPRPLSQGYRFKLPTYPIPKDVRDIIESKIVPDVIEEGLGMRNYARYFSTLIAMEEIGLEEAMRAHDMEGATMKRRGNQFLSLEVPGLAERRPSLVNGDYIFARRCTDGQNDTRPYQGYIHRVEADEIFLMFEKTFHQQHRGDDIYNVSFTYNRINMRRLYHAVQAAEKLWPGLLFPSPSPRKRVIRTALLNPLNGDLNKEQANAVVKILGCKGAPPYVIYGPPGTGKTMALVEAMLQIHISRKDARILVCAASNFAADYMLERLIGEAANVRENEIFRLNAMGRQYEDVMPDLLRFCSLDDNMAFNCPPLKHLLCYKIIVSTYMSASLLFTEGIRKGHFSHIFLDEAGQASEPETMVPISNLCVKETVIVLAGDPKQLGPVIYSKNAEEYGYGRSYLERLFEYEYYERGDENYITKLVRNYRCHPVILALPSKLFYDGELIACKEESDPLNYDCIGLPNRSFPAYFIGIQGCDEREGNNPSWFNRTEASKVVDMIIKLRMVDDLDEADIGVITPYRQQVLKIKKALESLDMPNVKVGTVEQYQGQEREVIIISTVRSTVKHNEFDQTYSLGFLTNPRRFNVAITRARSLLVIIGNPHIICKDYYWDQLLRYCADNGSYQGCSLPLPEMSFSSSLHDYPGEVEWGEVPKQYPGEPNWDESGHYQDPNEVDEWGEAPDQYSKEAKWEENVSEQYSDNLECVEDTSASGSKEWTENKPEPYHGEAELTGSTSNNPYSDIIPTGWGD